MRLYISVSETETFITEFLQDKSKMPDNKQLCKVCKTRHLPPTGKKCKRRAQEENDELLRDAAVAGPVPASQAAQAVQVCLFIWGFTSLSTLYRSYHDG